MLNNTKHVHTQKNINSGQEQVTCIHIYIYKLTNMYSAQNR